MSHRNLISRIGIRTVVGFFTVQWNGASVVGKGKEEKFIFLTKWDVFMSFLGLNIKNVMVQYSLQIETKKINNFSSIFE
jgi:hypothetical protein